MNIEECFLLGIITKPIGLKGHFLIKLETDTPERYYSIQEAFFQIKPNQNYLVPFFFSHVSPHKPFLLRVATDTIHSVDEAKKLKGIKVFLPLSMLPKKKGKHFYFHEIIGFEVIDQSVGPVGNIRQVIEYPHQSVIQVFKNNKEILIPITENIIKKVDRKNKKLFIDAPSGLIDLYLHS